MSPFLPKLQLEHVLHQMHLANSDGRSLAMRSSMWRVIICSQRHDTEGLKALTDKEQTSNW